MTPRHPARTAALRMLVRMTTALVCAGLGCATQQAGRSQSRPVGGFASSLLAALPRSIEALALIHRETLFAHEVLGPRLDKSTWHEKMVDTLGVDVAKDVDLVALATFRDREPEMIALLEGRFDAKSLAQKAGQVRGSERQLHRGATIFVSSQGAWALLDSSHLVLGSMAGVRRIIDTARHVQPSLLGQGGSGQGAAATGSGPSGQGAPAWQPLLATIPVEPAPFLLLVNWSESFRDEVERVVDVSLPLETLVCALGKGPHLDISCNGETAGDNQASAAVNRVRVAVTKLREQLDKLGIADLVADFTVEQQRSTVLIRYHLDRKPLGRLVDLLLHMAEAASSQYSQLGRGPRMLAQRPYEKEPTKW